jgi:NADH:ubiquinone oxidoreductase subunit 6 (subunit J)
MERHSEGPTLVALVIILVILMIAVIVAITVIVMTHQKGNREEIQSVERAAKVQQLTAGSKLG